MALPTFTTISNSQIDPDSPLDTTLFTQLRDNDLHINQRVGITTGGPVLEDHAHKGFGAGGDSSALISSVAAGVVFLDAPVNKVTINTSIEIPYTNIDVSADTAPDVAVIGIFQVHLTYSLNTTVVGAVTLAASIKMRKDALAIDNPNVPEASDAVTFVKGAGNQLWGGRLAGQLFVPLTASQICEFSVTNSISNAFSSTKTGNIVFVGYLK